MRRATKEKEVQEEREKNGRVAAFFDLDGTLMARPSIEWRFFRLLRYRGEIGLGNYLLWLREAARLLPRGIRAMLEANKLHWQGVLSFDGLGERVRDNPRLPRSRFFAGAMERVAWHAREGHAIVLVSGTLEPLAKDAARGLEAGLAERGPTTRIRVCATRLEENNGKWTGKILGEAMFGEAKARAVRRLGREMRLDLGQCFAYGDSTADEMLLASVGKAFAVNPSHALAGIARTHGWPILDWKESQE